MKNSSSSAYAWQKLRFVIHISAVTALLLSLYPYALGYQMLSPDWLALIVLYWLSRNHSSLSYWHIFLYGVIFDLLHFNFIGTESIGLLLLTYFFLRYRMLFQFLPKVAQIASIFVLLALKQFCIQWILGITGELPSLATYVIPPLIGALLWIAIDRLPLDKSSGLYQP